uniref:Uncharacterized protein n=1 Tax=Oryza sativa subsp. japonica TaxID=39947 RepID=Q6EPD8_ORYSJ|nr:hypothetical protein [Oryza sativa Japonica Group]
MEIDVAILLIRPVVHVSLLKVAIKPDTVASPELPLQTAEIKLDAKPEAILHRNLTKRDN